MRSKPNRLPANLRPDRHRGRLGSRRRRVGHAACKNSCRSMAEAPPNPELLALRDRIDAVDREVLAALNRRAALAKAVGELKKNEGSVVFRPEREAQVIDGLKSQNTGPLDGDSIAPIWREIMSAC